MKGKGITKDRNSQGRRTWFISTISELLYKEPGESMLRKSGCLQTQKWDVLSYKGVEFTGVQKLLLELVRAIGLREFLGHHSWSHWESEVSSSTSQFGCYIAKAFKTLKSLALEAYLTLLLQTHSCRQTGLASEYTLHILTSLFCASALLSPHH